jgi:hypothetical protein
VSCVISSIRNLQYNKRILILGCILLILTAVVLFTMPKVRIYLIEKRLTQRVDTQHFSVFYSLQDTEGIKNLNIALESNLDKILRDLDNRQIWV